MMKFDHSSKLPPSLKETERFILPVRNGLYAILKGDGYHCPEPCPRVIDFPRQTDFELQTTQTGISEMQHLDIAFNTGVLGHFLEEPQLYPTIRGRKRSPRFDFFIGEHHLEVEGVQVEIDGGFEARGSVTVVEAKIGQCEDFHLRQLYYPFRFWSTQTSKLVRPVFFTYDPATELYEFREYAFQPADRYDSARLVKASAYRIVEAEAAKAPRRSRSRKIPFPQADKLAKIAILPFLVAEGHNTPEAVAPLLDFNSPRQGRYYLDAGRSLGLIDKEFQLTSLGQDYIDSVPGLRHRMLCRAVLALESTQEVLSALLMSRQHRLAVEEVSTIVECATGLAPVTARRRTQTLMSWLTWVSAFCSILQVDNQGISLTSHSVKVEKQSVQLDLF